MDNFFEFIEEDIEAKKNMLSTMPINNKTNKGKYNDALEKVLMQLNIPTAAITNPIVSNVKVESLEKILGKKLGSGLMLIIITYSQS